MTAMQLVLHAQQGVPLLRKHLPPWQHRALRCRLHPLPRPALPRVPHHWES